MRLQEEMIKRIDEFGGIEKLTLELQKSSKMSQEKKWFDNMVIFFNNLYTQEMNVEVYALDYKQASLDTIAYLNNFKIGKDTSTSDFLINLIEFKLDYVDKIRKIS